MRGMGPADEDWEVGGPPGGCQRDLPRWHILRGGPGPATRKSSYLRRLAKQAKREHFTP